MPVTRGTGMESGRQQNEDAAEARRLRQQEMRDRAERITPTTPPIPGRLTMPLGTFVSNPLAMPNPLALPNPLQVNPSTAASGAIGGQFGNVPGRPPGAYNVPTPPGYTVPNLSSYNLTPPASYNPREEHLYRTLRGAQALGGTGAELMSPTQRNALRQYGLIRETQPLLGNDGENSGGYGTPGHYGYNPSGNPGGWTLRYNNQNQLVWKLNRNREQQARVGTYQNRVAETQTAQQLQQSLFYQNMSWRLATG